MKFSRFAIKLKMLYFLQSTNSDKAFYLINQNEFIIGRKNCDILIANDSSISKEHAKVRIKEDKKVTVEDLKSKYKTFINGKKMEPNVEVQLNDKDKIQFGGLNSIFIFQQIKYVTTATQLSSNQKGALKRQLKLLQGQYEDNWSSQCTHLTLEKISLTVKVLQALLEDKPIVMPGFWTKFAENVAQNLAPPNIAEYNDPPLADALLNKVEFKNAAPRKNLFMGKIFLFSLDKEKKQVEELIEKAGGSSISWETTPLQVSQITEDFLIMQSSKDVDDKAYKDIVKHFSKQNKRTIPIQEIAMAIIHGSCEKDCNPDFNRAEKVFNASKDKEPTQHHLLAQNTESQDLSAGPSHFQKVIPETIDPDQMDVPPIKKKECVAEVIEIMDSKDTEKEKETVKRIWGDVDDRNPSKSKKIKLEIAEKTTRSLQSEDKTNNESTKERSKQNAAKGKQSHKRKALEESDSEDDLPRKEKTKNPFIAKAKKNRAEETVDEKPFTSVRKQTGSITVSPENPLLRSIRDEKIVEPPRFSSTKIEDKDASREERVYYSKISRTASADIDSTWYSKKNSSDVILENEEINTELQQFIDLFKEKVVVEVLSNLTIRSKESRDEVDFMNRSNGKNFKKFRKVKPLHPQTSIIGIDSFKMSGCDNTTGINDTRRRVVYDSDDERPSPSNAKQKRKLKSFDI